MVLKNPIWRFYCGLKVKKILGIIFCLQILANLEKLGIPEEFADLTRALLAHRCLDKLVSKPVLPADYADIIQGWREAMLELFLARNITFTNKMHIVYHHLEVD